MLPEGLNPNCFEQSKLFSKVQIWVDEQRWCSDRIGTFQAIEKGSIPVRCKRFRLSILFSSLFDTDELSIPRFSFFHVRVDKPRWWSGSIVAFQVFDMGSISVRSRSYSVDRNFAVVFVTKDLKSLLFSFFHVGVEEHLSGNIVALEKIDLCSTTAWCKRTILVTLFWKSLASGKFKSIMISTVQVALDQRRWCSGSIVDFQDIDMVSIPVRCRRANLFLFFAKT